MVEPKATSVITAPFGALVRNPGPMAGVLAILVLGSTGSSLIPLLGGLASAALFVMFIPVLSTIIRAHVQGQSVSFGDAWNASTGHMLRYLGYSLLVGVIVFAVAMVFVIGIAVSTGSGSGDGVGAATVIGAVIAAIVLIPLAWWGMLVGAAAAAGSERPLSAPSRLPVSRSVGSVLLGGLFYTLISLPLYALIVAPFLSKWDVLTDPDISEAALESELNALFTGGFIIVLLLTGMLLQVIATLWQGGLTALFGPGDTAALPSSTPVAAPAGNGWPHSTYEAADNDSADFLAPPDPAPGPPVPPSA